MRINQQIPATEGSDAVSSTSRAPRIKHRTEAVKLLFMLPFAITMGCGVNGTQTPPPTTVETPKEQPESKSIDHVKPSPRPDREACLSTGEAERLQIEVGSSAKAKSGLTVRFKGTSHDDFEGGGFDLNLILEIVSPAPGAEPSSWMPSARAKPAFIAFGEYCVRLEESSEQRITVTVAPATSPEPEPLPHCAIACCPDNLQVPAPDGTIECCFCDESDLQ